MKTKTKILGMLVVASGLALAAGCAVYVPHHRGYEAGVVYSDPPAPEVEVIPVAPGPAYVWIGGCWEWHNSWVWMPGHYVHAPHPGAAWVSPEWHHQGRGWARRPGHWR